MDSVNDPQNVYDNLSHEKREKQAKAALRIQSEHTLRSENLPFDIDVWYPIIKQFTFRSVFLPLKKKEAHAFINTYNTVCLGRHWLRPQDVVILKDLENRIDSLLKTHFRETGAFLRLCGRSPKDADPLNPEDVLNRYHKELQRLLLSGYPDNPNTKFIAFIGTNWMRITNGAEAMSLLVTSERVHVDMDDWLRYGEPEQIVLREWEPELSMENEFRCFVHRNQLNAISQYDHYGVFPHLESIKDKVQEKIFSSWKEVHPLIGEESYMIDYVYLPKSDRVVVIELSPFLTCTGPACFRWSNKLDLDILENGPFEFRLKKESTVTEGLIVSGVEDRFQGGQPKYYDWYKTVKLPPKKHNWQNFLYVLFAGLIVTTWLPLLLPSSWEFSSPLPSWVPFMGLVACIFLFFKSEITSFLNNTPKPSKHKIFFYGTLKRGFHWNQKFLSDSEFLTTATTCEPLPLVIGACGVPYLLNGRPGQGKNVRGEVWCVDDETLEGMDEYEGLRKGYYCRHKIMVRGDGARGLMEVDVYFKLKTSETEFENVEYEEEYTKEYHDLFYKPIRHIQIKQRAYLGINYDMRN